MDKTFDPYLQQALLLMGLLCLSAIGLSASECYLLVIAPEQIARFPEPLLRFGKTLFPLARPAAPLLYLLTWLLVYSSPFKKITRPSSTYSLLAASIFLSGACYLALPTLLPLRLFPFLYPPACIGCLSFGPILAKSLAPTSAWGIQSPRRRQKSKLGFHIKLRNGWINIPNPFRGVLVIGGAGSGKSRSIAEPILLQAATQNYTGILYDFKFPVLTEQAYGAYLAKSEGITFYVINFEDLSRSHRVNPLRPDYLPSITYAEAYAQALITNLLPESIQHKDFWIRSATAILTATIWYMRKHHPDYCTLPHVISLICNKHYEKLVALLEAEPETSGLVSSLAVAIEKESEKQIAGVMGSIQIALSRLDNPAIAWVLSGNDVDLRLNDPEHPAFLCIGSASELSDALAPVISCIITVALKQMNQPGGHHSLILLDEAPTLHIPRFDQIPATARSNKIATVFMAQDISQIVQAYGHIGAEVILGNLGSQLFGRLSSPQTAAYVSSLFGKELREVPQHQQSFGGMGRHARHQRSVSFQSRETEVFKPSDAFDLEPGEFVGLSAGESNERFQGKVILPSQPSEPLPAFASGIDVEGNFRRIRREARRILGIDAG